MDADFFILYFTPLENMNSFVACSCASQLSFAPDDALYYRVVVCWWLDFYFVVEFLCTVKAKQ